MDNEGEVLRDEAPIVAWTNDQESGASKEVPSPPASAHHLDAADDEEAQNDGQTGEIPISKGPLHANPGWISIAVVPSELMAANENSDSLSLPGIQFEEIVDEEDAECGIRIAAIDSRSNWSRVLKPGLVLHSIQGQECKRLAMSHLHDLWKEYSEDSSTGTVITITWRDFQGDPASKVALLYKMDSSALVGLAFKTRDGSATLQIKNIRQPSMASDSVLEIDDVIVGLEFPDYYEGEHMDTDSNVLTPEQARSKVLAAQGSIVVSVAAPLPPPPPSAQLALEPKMSETSTETAHRNGSKQQFAERAPGEARPTHVRSRSYLESLPVVDAQLEEDDSEAIAITELIPIPVDMAETNGKDHWENTASLIGVYLSKESKSDRFGISFIQESSRLCVGKIHPGKLMSESHLRPGDRIISINHHLTSGWTSGRAVQFLRKAPAGPVVLLAEHERGDPFLTEAVIFKRSQEIPVGIAFGQTEAGLLQISQTNPSGLIGSDPIIHGGDLVEKINGVDCREISPEVARSIVLGTVGFVSILVRTSETTLVSSRHFEIEGNTADTQLVGSSSHDEEEDETAAEAMAIIAPYELIEEGLDSDDQDLVPAYISVLVYKPTQETQLGIVLAEMDSMGIVAGTEIRDIKSGGLLESTPLSTGYHIISIDNRQCQQWNKQAISDYLSQAVGNVNIIAYNPSGNSSLVQATAVKRSPRARIGVTFIRKGGRLRLGTVNPDSPFAQSVLNSGDFVLTVSLDGRPAAPVRALTALEAVRLVSAAKYSVTILTRTERSTGVVVSQVSERRPSSNNAGARSARVELGFHRRRQRNRRRWYCAIVACAVFIGIAIGLTRNR